MNARLVDIKSAEENDFLINNLKDPGYGYCIGLNDISVEGTHRWIDGSEATFYDWATGEGNSEVQDCSVIGKEGWYDGECNLTRKYICKMKRG